MNTVTLNLPTDALGGIVPLIRGNTLPQLTIRLRETAGPGVTIIAENCEIRTQGGQLVYDWPATISGDTVVLASVPANTTASWPLGVHNWEAKLTHAYGTYAHIGGTFTIVGGVAS